MMDKLDLGLSLSLAGDAPGHHDNNVSYAQRRTEWPWSITTAPVMCSSGSGEMKLFGVHGVEDAPRPLLRVIDVNQKPKAERSDQDVVEEDEEEEEEEDDEDASSSPVSVLSRASGKRSSAERDPFSSELVHRGQQKRTSSGGTSDEEDGEGSRKKLRLSKEQSAVLEECFKEHNTLNPKQKMALSKQLGLRPRQVEVWFQNRRARTKLKQTEVYCEYLKRWCEKLTEENRRLQKETAELRALKMMPAAYGHLHTPAASPHLIPPATLTMCPSCQRVVMPSSAASASNGASAPHGAGAKHRGHLFAINGAM